LVFVSINLLIKRVLFENSLRYSLSTGVINYSDGPALFRRARWPRLAGGDRLLRRLPARLLMLRRRLLLDLIVSRDRLITKHGGACVVCR